MATFLFLSSYGLVESPEIPIDLALLIAVRTDSGIQKVVVAAAIVADGRVLACARAAPPETAGRWEFPGGKVEPGETEVDAVARECAEELGVTVRAGGRVGQDVPLRGDAVLRVYLAQLIDDASPRPLEHLELRWLGPADLDSVPWLPADEPIAAALHPILLAWPAPTP